MMVLAPRSFKTCRRSRKLKPGKTAKNNDRIFVVHEYRDRSIEVPDIDEHGASPVCAQEGYRLSFPTTFPMKLHELLDRAVMDGLDHIISWAPHGRCFVIRKPKEFVDIIIPQFFRQSKITSFQRQLNLYGFNRLTKGLDKSGYYNSLFLRGRPHLCREMVRVKVKGTGFKAASNPDDEPDFYALPFLPSVSPCPSECDLSCQLSIETSDDESLRSHSPTTVSDACTEEPIQHEYKYGTLIEELYVAPLNEFIPPNPPSDISDWEASRPEVITV